MNQDRECKYGCGEAARPGRTACGGCSKRMLCHGHLGTCGNHNARHPAQQSPSWRGEAVDYWAVMKRMRRYLGPAREKACVSCGGVALDWAYQHNDPDERISVTPRFSGRPFSLNAESYSPMCRRCHKALERSLAA